MQIHKPRGEKFARKNKTQHSQAEDMMIDI